MRNIACAGSTNILRIDYDEENCILEIEFIKDNSVYTYRDVPSYIVDELEAADSKGSYASKNIYKQFIGVRT